MTRANTMPPRRNTPESEAAATRTILESVLDGRPLSIADACRLLALQNPDERRRLRDTANELRANHSGNRFFFRSSGSIYLSRRCELHSRLYPAPGNPDKTDSLTLDDIDAQLERFRAEGRQRLYIGCGGYDTRLWIQGLESPSLLKTLARLLAHLREHAPGMQLAGFSPDEMDFLSLVSERSARYALEMLMDHGLQELGGQGTEILSDTVRQRISDRKATIAHWLEIAALAFRLHLPMIAALEMGPVETLRQRVLHLERLRGFLAEHPGAFRALHARMWLRPPMEAMAMPPEPAACQRMDRFKMTAVARLYLGEHLPDQAVCWSLATEAGEAEEGLSWGANGLGDTDAVDYPAFLAGSETVGLSEADFRRMILNVGGTPILAEMV